MFPSFCSTEIKPSPPSSVSSTSGTSLANPTTSSTAAISSSFIGQSWGDIDDSPSYIIAEPNVETSKDSSKFDNTLQEADTGDSSSYKNKSYPSTTRTPFAAPAGRHGTRYAFLDFLFL